MNAYFGDAAGQDKKQQERDDFALGRQLHERLRWSGGDTAFNATRELVVPHMNVLGTGEALARVLKAVDPATDNICTQDVFERMGIVPPWDQSGASSPSLRDLVYPKKKVYEETGSESNRELARILNKLTSSFRDLSDPVEALKRPITGDKVLYLPTDPDKAAEQKATDSMLQEGAAFKEKLGPLVKQELLGFLYDGRQMMSSQLQHALYEAPQILNDGVGLAKDIQMLSRDFAGVGYLVRETGRGISESSQIQSRPTVIRSAASTLEA